MTGWLPSPAEELFGAQATAEESYDVLTVDVPPAQWTTALETARTTLSCTYFDWLSAVDEPGTGFRICAHVVALAPVRRLLLRTTVPHDAPVLASAVGVYAGAAWHERETHEMFGVTFEGHPGLTPLLLPENFEGHPLRKDFVLAARVAKAWPGAKEPGESEHGGPKRRQMLPPGVPDPNEWGPLKGQLPAAPARPARGAGRAATGDRPVRRTRSASEGSATQPAASQQPEAPARPPRRSRSVTQGSASQRPTDTPTPAEAEAAREPVSKPESGRGTGATAGPPTNRPSTPRSSDAPWHHARPTFDAPPQPTTPEPERPAGRPTRPELEAERPVDKPTRPEPKPARAAAEPVQPAAAPGRPEPQTDGPAAAPAAEPEADGPAAAPARSKPEADRPVAEPVQPEPQAEQAAAESDPEADRPAAVPARPEPEADRPAAEPKPQPNQPAAAPKPDPAPDPAANPTSPTTPPPVNDDRTGGTE
ncbi:NADH-quinone oxidoreductase subunit C [Streptomyces huasconensis]|uniref:NADH-quinone oxidoreductase subunit C n=1 Tax=Streptomyces huasconensis TaxID=1854574 RepID=UPI0034320D5D